MARDRGMELSYGRGLDMPKPSLPDGLSQNDASESFTRKLQMFGYRVTKPTVDVAVAKFLANGNAKPVGIIEIFVYGWLTKDL